VSLLDAQQGTLLRTVDMDARPGAVAVDGRTGRTLVLSTTGARPPGGAAHLPGTVSVLDATSGCVLQSVVAGGSPWAVALDEATQRALVANAGEGNRERARHAQRPSCAPCGWARSLCK
jgi:DNA-binding beta-propeller fold protein YncE